MRIEFDPAAADSYAAVPLTVAYRCNEIVDRIEQDDPLRRHMTRRFADGEWLVPFAAAGGAWVLVWESDGDVAVVRHIGAVTSLGG